MPDERTQRPDDDRDDLIKRQQDEIARLREELARAERDRDRWKRRHERVKQQLDAARRAGFRQAAPFAKDHPQGTGRRGGTVVRRMVAALVDRCRRESMRPTTRRSRPRAPPVARRLRPRGSPPNIKTICRPFGRSSDSLISTSAGASGVGGASSRHPLQTSDALGAAAVHLGPQAVALVVVFHKHFGVSLEKIATVLRERFG